MQPGFLVILLARQAQVLYQMLRIIFTEHIPPHVVFRRPVCFSVTSNERQGQAAVVAVVQVDSTLRGMHRLQLVLHPLRRQAAPGQPLLTLFAEVAASQFAFQPVEQGDQLRRGR
ncbi:hypothetical protein ACUY4Q_003064 [Phytobacter sp. AG2a]